MCGIVGYVGSEQAVPIMLEGLRRLEYRGYDSAGVAVCSGGQLRLSKSKGYVKNLCDITEDGKLLPGTIGLGHTRWATHGQPTDKNAHPHISYGGKIAVVHNGIIENYIQLREMLISMGYKFESETDTEVAVNLIAYCLEGAESLLEAVARAARRMVGSYALGILCSDNPDEIIAVRKESPLVLGVGEGCNYLASDVTAILSHTRNVYMLDDNEVAVLTAGGIKIYNGELQEIQKDITVIDWDVSAAEKGGYEHFMLKEIMEQPDAVRKTISPHIKDGRVEFDGIKLAPEYIRGLEKIYIVGCGSAYHAGMVGKYVIEKLVRKPVELAVASEFRYCSPIVNEKTLVICISQSGTTADTIAAMREAKRLGARVLSIVNVVGSTIATESDDVLLTLAGPEIAVATTKAYSTQLAALYLVALYFADVCGTVAKDEYSAILSGLQELPGKLSEILDNKEHIQYLSSVYFNKEDIFFIGRNVDYAVSLEASLKLKEISYIHSEAYAAGELKHGTISLIEDGTLVIAIAAYEKLLEKMISNIVEVKTRGAEILTLTTQSCRELASHSASNMMVIPDIHEILLPSLAVVPMQLFSYYVALMRGCSIDKPRNLAKSVTVE